MRDRSLPESPDPLRAEHSTEDAALPDFDRLCLNGAPKPSPGPVTSASDDTSRPVTRGDGRPAPNVIVHVTVNGHANPVTVNAASVIEQVLSPTATPLQSSPSRHSQSPTIAVPSAPQTIPSPTGTKPLPDSSEAAVPAASPAARGPRTMDVIRGGGRVVIWDPACECPHLPAQDLRTDLQHDRTVEYIEPNDHPHYRKWYVVTAGLRVGIWKSWLDMEDYIDVKGRRFQSFLTREEAEHHYGLAKREGRVRLLK